MKRLLLVVMVVWGAPVVAQDEGGGSRTNTGANVGFETGFLLGNLLPDQISGVTEITGMGGVRAGYRIGALTFAESTLLMGNGHGVEWKNLSLAARIDIPVENIVGTASIGPDITYYQPANRSSSKLIFGGHVGGGVQMHIGGDTWFRADMKLGFSPGTSLFFGAGIVFRFPGGGGGAG